MESLKVLFLGFQKALNPIYNDFLHAIGENHTVHLYDANVSTTEQFNNIDVVVASTPELCTRQMIDVAVLSGVKLWQVLSTGLDHYNVAYFLERGLPLANTPGIFSSIALAEHALFLMLSLVKNFSISQKMIKDGKIYEPLNDELYGKTLGLIGFGASGRQLAKLTVPMEMRVVAVDILDIPIEICDEFNVEFMGGVEYLDQLLTMADFVSIHASLTSKSRHMINRKSFELMKPTSFLINVAR
ncbi:MAG: NAD(P)-dependent oxidoreductase, partial [Anaerolineales bacterium]